MFFRVEIFIQICKSIFKKIFNDISKIFTKSNYKLGISYLKELSYESHCVYIKDFNFSC